MPQDKRDILGPDEVALRLRQLGFDIGTARLDVVADHHSRSTVALEALRSFLAGSDIEPLDEVCETPGVDRER
jgi:hypothetical protein